ncbi:MAG TPA: MarR family transcriptional regulator [Trueperaceae bacterium]
MARRGLVEKAGRLWRVTDAGRAVLDPLVRFVPAREPVTGSQRAVLEALGADALTTTDVAARAGVERTNTHRRLEVLERLGRVERVPGRPVRWRRA